MNRFQIAALTVLLLLVLLTLTAIVRGWSARRAGVAWTFVWILAGVAIAKPQLTIYVAGKLGIGRGADLVLYSSVFAMLIGFFMTYARLRHLRRDVTLLSRHLALREVERAGAFPPRADGDVRRTGGDIRPGFDLYLRSDTGARPEGA